VVVFSLRLLAPPEKHAALLRSLSTMLGPTRVAPGCLGARLFTDVDNTRSLVLVEEWESRELFRKHLNTERLNVLFAAIDLSREPPTIRVDSVAREEGIAALISQASGEQRS
jgi:quinol monooxygenase YgiN